MLPSLLLRISYNGTHTFWTKPKGHAMAPEPYRTLDLYAVYAQHTCLPHRPAANFVEAELRECQQRHTSFIWNLEAVRVYTPKPQPFVMRMAPCSSPPPYSGVKLAPLSPFTTPVLAYRLALACACANFASDPVPSG